MKNTTWGGVMTESWEETAPGTTTRQHIKH